MTNLFSFALPGFLLIILSVEVILLSKLDKLFYGTYLTPYIVLSVPYLIVFLLAYSIGPFFGFVSLSYKVVLIAIVYLLIFWFFGSFLMMALIGKYVTGKLSFIPLPEKYSFRSLLIQLSWLMIIIITIKLIGTIIKFHGFLIYRDDFSKYFNSGFAGHLMTFLILLLMYFAISFKNEKKEILLISLILILLFIYQVKTWIFIPGLTVILYFYIEKRFYVKPRNIIYVVLAAYFIFLVIYFPVSGFSPKYFVQIYTYKFIFKHILFYLFSGVLAFSENMIEGIKRNIDPNVIISPFINIYRIITSTGPMQSIVSDLYYYVDKVKIENSNVATFFGTLIIYSGFIGAGIYTIFTGFIMYFFLLLNYIYKNIWLLIMYLFLLTGLSMGWLNFYFNNLNFVEIPVYCLLLALLTGIKYSKR
jgi:hypothetical protein